MRTQPPFVVLPTRREALQTLMTAATTALAVPQAYLEAQTQSPPAGAVSGCVVTPSQTEGPYFVDERLRRADIRIDPSSGIIKPGVPLTLSVRVSRIEHGQCSPMAGAVVDVWQCDAEGLYSDVRDQGRGQFDTRGQKFLRGYEITDGEGRVEFTTIYPGWYPGRTVHVHFKVRTSMTAGRAGEFTSQWYFDDAITDAVFAQGPYAAMGARSVRNDRDRIYRRGGRELMLNLTRTDSGYRAAFDLGINLS